VLNIADGGVDRILDFVSGLDKIRLLGVDLNFEMATDGAHLILDGRTGNLAFDADGAGAVAQPELLAQLVGVTTLHPNDFLIG
jgi:hypothetical protein